MLKALLRVRLLELLSIFTGAQRTKKAQSAGKLAAFAGLMLFSLAALGFLFWHIFDLFALPFFLAGLGWLYYALAALLAFALMFIGSVFAAKSMLYEARDNDLLLSMPIPPGAILFSRMFTLWVLNLVLELVVAVPAALAAEGLAGAGLAVYAVVFALLPLFALSVSALFGWLLSRVTARFGSSALLTTVLSVAFLALYIVFVSRMNVWLARLAEHPDAAAYALGAVAPLYWMGAAVAQADWGLLARAAALLLGVFVLTAALLAATFVKTATDRRGGPRRAARARLEKRRSPRRALFRRELARLLASPAYMLNGALGALLALAAAGALLIKGGEMAALPGFDQITGLLQALFLVCLCYLSGTVLVTAPSISLEGQTLWIVRSLPVPERDILSAKLLLHLAVGVPPVLLASCAAAWTLRTKGVLLALTLILPALFCLFTGLLGLASNLRHPSFNWVNETQAVKSSVSVMITMFVSWGILVLPVLVYVLWGDHISIQALGLAFTAALAAVCLLLWRWLRVQGEAILSSL